jgi:hypothetical protein
VTPRPQRKRSQIFTRAVVRKRFRRFWSEHGIFLLVILVFVVVLAAASIRWPAGLRVSGNLVAEAVTIVSDNGLRLDPDLEFSPPAARLSGLLSIQPPPEIGGASVSAATASLRGSRLTLSTISIGPGAQLALDAASAQSGLGPWLMIGNAGATLEFEVGGPMSMTAGDKTLSSDETSDPFPVVARSGGPEAPHSVLTVSGKATKNKLTLQGLPIVPTVSLLRFGRRSTTADLGTAFVSTIVSGSVTIVDVGRTTKLEANAALELENFHGHLVRLDHMAGGFRIGFAGMVDRIRIGPPGFADDVTPTCLDYLSHQEWIKLMWAAALAGIAALAKVRSWYVAKLD